MSRQETPSVHRTGFTRLSREDSSQSRPPKVNIIFVHGLRGHPQRTWEHQQIAEIEEPTATSSKRTLLKIFHRPKRATSPYANENGNQEPSIEHKVFWPRDYLLEDVPEAEVWTYGYNADVIEGLFKANNQNSVSQHGRDFAAKFEREIENEAPVIFVAHSLGGIIVKDAIRRSELCQSRTRLIVFLGTPHRGSTKAGWGVIASNLASIAFQDANKRVIRALEVNGEILDNIQDEFVRITHKAGITIHSFQEATAMTGIKGISGKVVEDYSSKVGLPPAFETVESIDANHTQIARCTSKTDPQYRDVVGVLKRFIRTDGELNGDDSKARESAPAIQLESKRDSSTGEPGVQPSIHVGEQSHHMLQANRRHYHIPISRNRRFTGRDEILDQLKEKLFISKECQKLAIVGLGGVGKTQVALQLAYWVKDKQPEYSVFWVPAQSDESFEKAYIEIARQHNVEPKDDEDLKESVRRYLESERAGKWFLIVDNADDMETLFISTGQSRGIDYYLPETDNGLTLFTTRSREVAVAAAGSDVVSLHEMSKDEAIGFLNKTLIDKELLRDESTTEEFVQELTYLPLAIAQAAAYLNQNQMSIKRYLVLLRNTEKDLVSLMSREFHDNTRYRGSQNAVATTWLVSFNQIQRSDANAAELLSFMSYIEPKGIPLSILPRPFVDAEMEHAIGVLCGYAFLVRRKDEETFDMHRLVHIAIRVWIEKQDLVKETETRAIQHLEDVFPSNDKENRSQWREYLPHAQHALRVSQENRDATRFDLFYWVGRCLSQDRRFKEAIIALEETYRWRKENLLTEDEKLLNSEHALAMACTNGRQTKKAIEILEHVVAVERRTLIEDHDRLASEHELARAYLTDRQIKKAIEILEHVVAVRRKTLIEEDHSRLTSEHELARAYLDDHQTKEAIKILEHVVAVRRKTLIEENNARLASEHELAAAYLDDHQTKEAIEILENVVAVQRKTLIEEDHSRLTSEHGLATAYIIDQQIKRAIEIFEHVVAVRKKTLIEEDYDRLASEHGLATAYINDRQIKRAIEIFEHVVAVEKEMDIGDETTLSHEGWLGEAYFRNGQFEEAVKIFEHVIAVGKEMDIGDETKLAREGWLGEAYFRNGQFEEAVKIFEHVIAVRKEMDIGDETKLAREGWLGEAYFRNGQFEEAVKIFEHVIAVGKEMDIGDETKLAREGWLGEAYFRNGQCEEAVKIFEHVIAVGKELDISDESKLTSEYWLGKAYVKNRQFEKAIKILERIVAVGKGLDIDVEQKLIREYRLGEAYIKNGQFEEAIKILEHVVAAEEALDISDESKGKTKDLLAKAYVMREPIRAPPRRFSCRF